MENPVVRTYRDLEVWKKSIALAESCYRHTLTFPREEMYGLSSQIRRCSVSVAANIAEGHGRESTASFIQFLRISQGSTKELETHWIIAERVGLIKVDALQKILSDCDSIGKMLHGLIRALQSRQKTLKED